jgi:hypothetical protein
MITGLSEYDLSTFATLLGHRTGARKRLQTAHSRNAAAIVTDLGHQRWGEIVASARQRSKQLVIAVLLKQLVQPSNLGRFVFASRQ